MVGDKKSDFEIIIASLPHREKLVAEIWYKNTHIAEINQEQPILAITLYDDKSIALPLSELQEVLEEAKQRLLG